MERRRVDAVFISDDGVKDNSFLNVAGSAAEGAYMTGPKDLSALPQNKAAVEAFRAAYGAEPGAFFQEGYAATLALLNAIQKAGSTDYDAVVNALRTEYVETPVGLIKFDEKGDAEGVGFSMFKVENGTFVEMQ
jgi:branched-chain amino acid transport system substrate-binding protein